MVLPVWSLFFHLIQTILGPLISLGFHVIFHKAFLALKFDTERREKIFHVCVASVIILNSISAPSLTPHPETYPWISSSVYILVFDC